MKKEPRCAPLQRYVPLGMYSPAFEAGPRRHYYEY